MSAIIPCGGTGARHALAFGCDVGGGGRAKAHLAILVIDESWLAAGRCGELAFSWGGDVCEIWGTAGRAATDGEIESEGGGQ